MSFMGGYSPNYFSIDDILATQERTPCKFVVKVPKLGAKLNPSVEEEDLQAGVNLELPMWLVQQMATGRQPIVGAELPRVYKEVYREILNADPTAVDLHKFGLYFYELGSYAKQFDIRGEVAQILIYTFKGRFRKIMDLADSISSDPSVQDQLDVLEQRLYKLSYKSKAKLNVWLMQSDIPLEAASMVVNHKKRKRVDIDDMLL